MGRPDGPCPGHWQRPLRRLLLLEQRQPRADVVQAGQRHLGPARPHLPEAGALAAGTQLPPSPQPASTITYAENVATGITATDTALTGGAPGIMANQTATAADWSGGNVSGSTPPPVPTYTIGGTVSGLSGTVVLQDNGADNLSVSSNGTFTFPTSLLAGQAYNVTVATKPTGQQCTVSNGSGTVGQANVTNVTVTCGTPISDNFARANGGLGPNWTALSDGPLAISSQMVVGTNAGGDSGDIRTAEVYQSDQYSTVQVTSSRLTGTQWVGPMVRALGTGSGLYVGFYFWNSGNPELGCMLFKRVNGTWGQLGPTYPSGALAAGTQLTLTAAGSTLTFAENGATVITATDTALTGGAPGIMANQTATAADWSGGNVSGSTPPPVPTYTIGGTVSGLSGTVVLQDNGADNLSVSGNGTFTFPHLALGRPGLQRHRGHQAHRSSSARSPAGPGTVGSANVANVSVTCITPTISIGGSVSQELSGTIFIQDNGGDNLSVSSNGTFTFPSLLATGETYDVTVVTNPTSQQCAVSNGSGTVGTANVTNILVTCTTLASTVSDNFARANGGLGPNWTALSDGPLAISSQMVIGTTTGGTSGDIRTAETYASDQYSTVQVSSSPLTGTQWIGPMVRVQGTGNGLYVGTYKWNSGSPELMLFKRLNGTWAQLGSTYSSGPLPAGTQLTLTEVGNTLAFAQNGDIRITATDISLTGGAPWHHGQWDGHRHQLDRWQFWLPG